MGSLDRRQATVMARKELVMALYELGMSYLKGWGVHKDKSVAFTYFKIAADLVSFLKKTPTISVKLGGTQKTSEY